MEKMVTVLGTTLIIFGLAQGISLGVLEGPILDGIIGGLSPLLAGMIGTYALTWKG